jgi:hypothetical protein
VGAPNGDGDRAALLISVDHPQVHV